MGITVALFIGFVLGATIAISVIAWLITGELEKMLTL